ncbi:MAG: alpha-amylase family glycosyl hydrolase [Acidimicrobiales bacterium]
MAAARRSPRLPRWSERDAWLICYPDQFGPSGIGGVRQVVGALAPEINGVHLLPFHPSSSDGGFSVEDYAVVDPAVGTWRDIEALASDTRLMADAVINHVSAQGAWFRAHLAGDAAFVDFFFVVPDGADLSAVARPRPGPPVTRFVRNDGSEADYWTTFSADQVDLDYRSPDVLLAVCEAVFRFVAAGASAVRLDAVAFLWKDAATTSMHLPQTHSVVALLRDCLDEIDPGVVLITETNVPHADNVAYLGTPERPGAHAVYQFTLAPLVLHALHTGDTDPLCRWITEISLPPGTTVMNFLASHDGVGVRPAKGWLTVDQVAALAGRCVEAGGRVNEAATPGGSEPYELAATWRSLCEVGVGAPFDADELAARIVAGHSIALALVGIPLLYVHSPAASPNAFDRVDASGVPRDLNRGRFPSPQEYLDALERDPIGSRVWPRLREMLVWRRERRAFHPEAEQELVDAPAGVVAIRRGTGTDTALVVTNLTAAARSVPIGPGWERMDDRTPIGPTVELGPWAVRWLARTEAGTVSAP